MAASYPGAVKTFSAVVNGVTKLVAALFNSAYDEITAIETELGIDVAGSATDLKTRLAIAMTDAGYVKSTGLNTTTGEVSNAVASWTDYNLPGGQYGFYPQVKSAATMHATIVNASNFASYLTQIAIYADSGTAYAQQRYVTASGTDMWIFLLIDKTSKIVVGGFQAMDHPAYGNGGDFEKLPHPFLSYDPVVHEIILLNKETCALLKKCSEESGKSILTLVHEDYRIDFGTEEVYEPLHSGKFIDGAGVLIKELVNKIPDYIKVRKLLELDIAEKEARKIEVLDAIQKNEQDKILKEQDRNSAKNKLKALGLTTGELESIVFKKGEQ